MVGNVREYDEMDELKTLRIDLAGASYGTFSITPTGIIRQVNPIAFAAARAAIDDRGPNLADVARQRVLTIAVYDVTDDHDVFIERLTVVHKTLAKHCDIVFQSEVLTGGSLGSIWYALTRRRIKKDELKKFEEGVAQDIAKDLAVKGIELSLKRLLVAVGATLLLTGESDQSKTHMVFHCQDGREAEYTATLTNPKDASEIIHAMATFCGVPTPGETRPAQKQEEDPPKKTRRITPDE